MGGPKPGFFAQKMPCSPQEQPKTKVVKVVIDKSAFCGEVFGHRLSNANPTIAASEIECGNFIYCERVAIGDRQKQPHPSRYYLLWQKEEATRKKQGVQQLRTS